MKLLIPLKLSTVLADVHIAPPAMVTKIVDEVALKLSTVLWDVDISPPLNRSNVSLLPRKVVFPVIVRLLSEAVIAPPSNM